MMIMVGIFSKTGFFEWAGVKAFKYSGGIGLIYIVKS
jgi:Na+/H+ antiporter NhaD/arsenite permease-like protein